MRVWTFYHEMSWQKVRWSSAHRRAAWRHGVHPPIFHLIEQHVNCYQRKCPIWRHYSLPRDGAIYVSVNESTESHYRKSDRNTLVSLINRIRFSTCTHTHTCNVGPTGTNEIGTFGVELHVWELDRHKNNYILNCMFFVAIRCWWLLTPHVVMW